MMKETTPKLIFSDSLEGQKVPTSHIKLIHIIGIAKGTYDKIFDPQQDQMKVYDFIEPSISKVTDGIN